MGLAADVLAGPRPERVVERVLVGVDEEVDRLGLGDAEQGPPSASTASSPIFERPLTEGIVALVPVDPDDSPLTVFQSNRVVRVDGWTAGPRASVAVGGGDPPAQPERGVRDEVAVRSASSV